VPPLCEAKGEAVPPLCEAKGEAVPPLCEAKGEALLSPHMGQLHSTE